ncbi:MAG TPA: peptidoglycan-binding domain-containing protein, partial [Clostridia bacterium]|nr:peptidoglycan-binding domain-containing protein [Clostridia bacterium]
MQKRLAELGYYDQTPTGQFDDATLEAVRAYARDHHLADNEVCGQEMWDLLFGTVAVAETEKSAGLPPPSPGFTLASGALSAGDAASPSWSYAFDQSFNTNEYNYVA